AGIAILGWLPMLNGNLALPTALAPRDWHIHEMLYGYLPAVITGFLLTAIPNWTSRLPIQGKPLLTLLSVWMAGRFAVAASLLIGWLLAAMIDVSFLLLVIALAAREIVVDGSRHGAHGGRNSAGGAPRQMGRLQDLARSPGSHPSCRLWLYSAGPRAFRPFFIDPCFPCQRRHSRLDGRRRRDDDDRHHVT